MDQNLLETLKKNHDHYVNAHQIITQRTKFYVEEFETVQSCTAFLKQMVTNLKEQIEKLEKETNSKVKEVQASPADLLPFSTYRFDNYFDDPRGLKALNDSDFEIATKYGSIKFSEVIPEEWRLIKVLRRQIMNEKIVNHISKAYILAFWRFVNYKLTLLQPFDQNTVKKDK